MMKILLLSKTQVSLAQIEFTPNYRPSSHNSSFSQLVPALVCISSSLVVALRIVSHLIDLDARDLRVDMEDDRIVSSTLAWYVMELQEPTVCTLPQVVMASVSSSGRGSFTGSPVGCRDTICCSVFHTRDMYHSEAISECFLFKVSESSVGNVLKGTVAKYLQ